MVKSWIIKDQGNELTVQHLMEVLGIERSIANLLAQRNIKTFDEARAFFRPNLKDLHDPFLMRDMEKAVERIKDAIAAREKLLIYGDYDVDGTTSVSMMYSFFRNLYDNIDFYIPDRYSEGYGISFKSIEYAALNGFKLIIALDCGIKAVEKVKFAAERGIDFIICDHHTAGDIIPDAVAVLDPKREGCNYPFKELSGCGVGFKLIQAYAIKNNIPLEKITPFLDLVAVSIASDIVPIIGENRVLAHYGLQELNNHPRTGLKAIIKIAGLEEKDITIDDIVFKIGPRINAAGRIESGKSSVELLIADTEDIALSMGSIINDFNNTRRTIDGTITEQAKNLIAASQEMQTRKSTVLYNSDWHKGVIGIVASRLIESYYRPTIILTESNGYITGSARSVTGFDLYQAIDACSDLLENFGGHMYAAGLTMKKENLKAFQRRFEEVVSETISPEMLIPVVEIDTEIKLSDITQRFFRILKQFQPFGPGNMAPVFLTENAVDNGTGGLVGAAREHLKLNLIQEEDPYTVFPAIAFNQAHHHDKICNGYAFDICYNIDENEFRGNVTLQLKIKDIKTD
ncbi:MAG TPA: single-stranded-DNA-specific exonuclease RecJ [Bacteroidales bacterium]|nr:single-stranded-DNA-specific exonuclease RecJ [Bacteroidales bacterium]